MTTTISVIAAGAGSFPGASRVHPRLLEEAATRLRRAEGGLLVDSFVARCGDGLGLVMTHARGAGDAEVHALAREVLDACAGLAAGLRLHGAERVPIAGAAELEFEERASEPVLVFLAAAPAAGAWNLHLYRAFADPFTTPRLASEPGLRDGFVFEILDLAARRRALVPTPEESYTLLACIGTPERFAVARVLSRSGAPAAAVSTSSGGRAVMVVRAESEFPTVAECLGAFTAPGLVPVAACDAFTVLGGPPRTICLGFQLCNGRLIGPADLFDDPAFDRMRAPEPAGTLRGPGPFAPRPRQPDVAERPGLRWEPSE